MLRKVTGRVAAVNGDVTADRHADAHRGRAILHHNGQIVFGLSDAVVIVNGYGRVTY